jgi:hypothetical protein
MEKIRTVVDIQIIHKDWKELCQKKILEQGIVCFAYY